MSPKGIDPHCYTIHGRQVYDSRGNPTVEAELELPDGSKHLAIVPSGASTGKYEAIELRDADPKRNLGKSVLSAVKNINEIIFPSLIASKIDITNQRAIDEKMIELDGTANKSKLGANAILAVSMVACRAAAHIKGIPLYKYIAQLAQNEQLSLPIPSFNVINGGVHAGNLLPIQEFMIMPTESSSFGSAMEVGCNIYQTMKKVIKESYGISAINVGDEGGFAPPISNITECLTLLTKTINACGYEGKVKLALDAAASEFRVESNQEEAKYNLQFKDTGISNPKLLTGSELTEIYKNLCQQFPLVSIEDPFDQDDWNSWSELRKALPNLQIVGDDLVVSNASRIKTAISRDSCNCLLLKINQVGTITEAITSAKIAKESGWKIMVSHRSGETEDIFIADLAVGISANFIKSGAPCRSERVAKIEDELSRSCKK